MDPRRLLAAVLAALARPRAAWRLAGYLALWLLAMVAAVLVHDPFKRLDWWVLSRLDATGPAWPARLAVVDLDWNHDPAGLEAFRTQMTQALETLAAMDPPPAVVVVDVGVSTVPIALDRLRAALQALIARHVEVVQVVSLDAFQPGLDYGDALAYQGRVGVFPADTSFGHARFDYSGRGSAWYRPCETVLARAHGGGPPCVPAVPAVVAHRVDEGAALPDDAWARPVVILPPAAARAEAWVWRWTPGRGLVAPPGRPLTATLGGRIVVLGDVDADVVDRWPGPVLLASAIGAAIATPATRGALLLDDGAWALGTAAVASLATLTVFALLRRADRRARHLGAAAIVAALVAALLLAGAVLLAREAGVLAYQVSFAAIGIAVSAAMAWSVASKALRQRALFTSVVADSTAAPTCWDVFVSYSHTPAANVRRVKHELVEPLRRLSTHDGPLRVFFDESAIRIGTSWYVELAEGIERSRCFVAVYGGDYFNKNFCRFELRKAVVRDIGAQGKGFRVLPFCLERKSELPPEFAHLQYRIPSGPEDMIVTVQATLRELGIETW